MAYEPTLYLRAALDTARRKKTISTAVRALKKYFPDAEAVAFTGLSGGLVAPAIATKLKLPLIAVRKEATKHSDHLVEVVDPEMMPRVKYIIVDDLIDSGATIHAIHDTIADQWPDAELLGAWMYLDAHCYEADELLDCYVL